MSLDCSRMRWLKDKRRRLIKQNAEPTELDAINTQIADHRNFWHPHNCEPAPERR